MNGSPDLFSTAIKMMSALGIVLACMFVAFYFMKRFMNRDTVSSKAKLIKVLANTYIGVKKSVSLIEVPGSVLVVGITNDKISLLTKIEDKEVLESICLSDERKSQTSFSDHLQKISSRFKTQEKKS